MAVKTSAELKTQIDTIIKVNGNREITPPKHNSILTNVIDSYLNKSDGGVLSAMLEYSYNPSFTTDYQIIHKKYVDDAISGITTGLTYQGTWDANTNTPTIASGIGTNGYYYIVNVAGTTNIDGVNDWEVGDWILFNGTTWQKIDQSTKWSDGFPTYDLRYQGLAANLTSLSGLTYASTSFVKMTAAGTFALDTNTYASASDLTSYAKLDGSNTPFTGNIRIEPTSGDSLVVKGATNDSTTKAISVTDLSGTEYWRVRNDGAMYGTGIWVNQKANPELRLNHSGSYSTASGQSGVFFRDSATTTRAFMSSFLAGGAYYINLVAQNASLVSSTNSNFFIANTDGSNRSLSTTFLVQNIGGTTYSTFTNSANVNNLVLSHSLKIGNTTQTAAAAGAGSLKYDSGFYGSDGASWNLLATSADLSSYAKLDGSNQPFTSEIFVLNASSKMSLKASGTYPTTYGNSMKFGFLDSTGTYRTTISSYYQTGKYILDIYNPAGRIWWVSDVQEFFNNAGTGVQTTYTANTGNWNFTGFAKNLLTIANGIKIGNNTDTAAAAGAGSIRYNSGLEVSDASNWEKAVVSPTANVKVTAAAPYTNDGYIEVRINGTLIKLMTTA